MKVGELIRKLSKRDRAQYVYYRDANGLHEITDVTVSLIGPSMKSVTILMNGDGGRYNGGHTNG